MILKNSFIAVCCAAFVLQAAHGLAEEGSPSPAGSPGAAPAPTAAAAPQAPGGGGNADFRQRMNDRLKGALKASDDEWAVIQPLLEKVQTAQRAMMAGRLVGLGGAWRRGGGGGNEGGGGAGSTPGASPAYRPSRYTSPEAEALRAALESDSASPEEIKEKLQALRDARKKAATNLEAAREDLRKVLTLRQEATLVQMGILE